MQGTDFLVLNNYNLLFVISFCLSLALTPIVIKLGKIWGLMDQPSPRKVHKIPLPRSGGLFIYPLISIITLLVYGLKNPEIIGILGGGFCFWITGIIDDKYNLRARYKFIGQIIGAIVLVSFGIYIRGVSSPWGYLAFDGIKYPLTILWVVGVSNALNFIDGLDGLSSGIVIISSLAFFKIALSKGILEVAFLSIVLAGTMLGFLLYNFPKAKVILGDSGALTLGYFLSAISVFGALKRTTITILAASLIILALPIFDVAYAIIRRGLKGVSIFEADKGHIHHKLLSLGFTPLQVTLLLYLASIFLGLVAVFIGSK